MVTDLATFAWLSDVYVLDEHQGRGLGTAMVRLIVEHPAVDERPAAVPRHRRRPRACTRGSATRRSPTPSGGWCGVAVTFPDNVDPTLRSRSRLPGATAAGATVAGVTSRRMSANSTVRNWARNQTCVPAAVERPSTTDEVAAVVAAASRSGQRVKAIGAGHSFTAAAMTNGVLLALDAMNAVEHVDVETGRVTVQGGIRLRDLCEELAAVGLAMPNLGDINAQSIAGAISTATHGTGAGLGNLATTIVGMELVNGNGEVITCDASTRPDLLRVARVGVGALGIVTKVTIQCVPAFDLHAVETIEVLDDVLDDFANFTTSAEHVEFYWMPGTRRCQVKRNHRTTEPARPQSRLAYVRDKYVAENAAFAVVCRDRPAVSGAGATARQARRLGRIRARPDRPQRSHLLQPASRALRRDGVRHPGRGDPGGRPTRPRADRHALVPAAVPDRGSRVGGRRHPAVDRCRSGERVDRRPPVPRRALRVVLPGRRGDHGRLRGTPALGQAALPVGGDVAARDTRSGTSSRRSGPSSIRAGRSATSTSTACWGRPCRSAVQAHISQSPAASRTIHVCSGDGPRRRTSAWAVASRTTHPGSTGVSNHRCSTTTQPCCRRSRWRSRSCAGTPATCTPSPRTRLPSWSRRRPTSPASSTRRSSSATAFRARTWSTSNCSPTCSPTAFAFSSPGDESQPTSPTSVASRTGACRPTWCTSCKTASVCCCAARSCGRRASVPADRVRGARSAVRPTRCCAT